MLVAAKTSQLIHYTESSFSTLEALEMPQCIMYDLGEEYGDTDLPITSMVIFV